MRNAQNRQIHRDSRSVVVWGWGGREEGGWEITGNAYGVSPWGVKNLLKLNCGGDYTTL